MSSPASVEPTIMHVRTDSQQARDMQANIQKMINLQYQDMQLSNREVPEDGDGKKEEGGEDSGDHRDTIKGVPKRTEMMDLNNANTNTGEITESTTKSPWPSEASGLPPPSPQQGVGRGTLYFPSTYQPNPPRSLASDSTPSDYLQMNPPQQIYTGYGAVAPEQQHHEFHYGNPDYHEGHNDDEFKRRNRSFCESICCLYRPFINYFSQEHLHRSFCYGAIDGMLTGSGIVSAFSALNILTVHTSFEVRLAVVVFSASACVADALCMAIGHIWTSFVVSSGNAQERFHERQLLHANKADAKAKLVDMLLARGMLKIDAMSLADTLEGYPDLFVSALMGDPLLAGGEEADDDTDDGMAPRASRAGFGSWNFPSYGGFQEIEHEPEAAAVNMAMKESQKEGLFMMLGFTCFAVVPSLLWLVLPFLVNPTPTTLTGDTPEAQVISLPSLVVSVSGLIMWCLGVWKSRFLDSNWLMFAVETVIVLLICVLSSYGVGTALSYSLGKGTVGLLLTNQI